MYLTNSETAVSCGTGRIKIPLAQDGFDVSGLDISDSMLTQAKEKYSKTKNLKGQAEFSKADLRYFDLKKKYSAEPFLKLKFNNNLLKTFSTLNLFQLL